MKFYAMNGAGNRFAIFDGRGNEFALTSELAISIGAKGGPLGSKGCDQIMVIRQSTRGDAFMEIWNNDGGQVEACGNATRCVGWLLLRESGAEQVTIETAAGLLLAKAISESTSAESTSGQASQKDKFQISVDMGQPNLEWDQIPLKEYMDTRVIDVKVGPIDAPILARPGAVNMGNPHCVFFVDDVEATAVETLGPMLEFHPLFPEQANIGFAQVLGPHHMRLRVWERGAGLTLACGTGACAAVVAAVRQSRMERKVRVDVDGGTLHIDWRASDDHVIMTGPVELEGSGELAL